MRFLSAAHTDVGITKKVNQDAFCLKIAKTPKTYLALAVICDGMGGLKQGELASALLVNAFSNWFENTLPQQAIQGVRMENIRAQWNAILQDQNKKIIAYGKSKNLSMGTTLSAVLIAGDQYILAHVGDSRIYLLSDHIWLRVVYNTVP